MHLKYHTYKYHAPIHLEDGEFLPELELGYTTYGELNEDKSNVIWVCHAFTGNANPSDWWGGLIGETRLFNANEHCVICVNIPGSNYGSSNPLSINPETGQPFYFSFPMLTIRDVTQCFELLRRELGIDKIHTLMGGSLGGQQAVEWAVSNPSIFENLILFSTNAVHSPWGIALNESQRMAIASDPTWQEPHSDAGKDGMAVARSIALLSYRNYETYNRTQSRDEGQINFFRASTYQTYQGEKIKKRFNAYSYWVLSRMFDSHDVGRGRGGIKVALAKITARTLVIGITSDILFPPAEQELLAVLIPNSLYAEIDSTYGHDGFLIEFEEMTKVITNWQN